MSPTNGSGSDCDLQSYVDGELDSAQRAEIDELLTHCPVTSARVRDYQRINEALQHLHAQTLDEPVPARLLRKPATRRGRPGLGAAAGLLASVSLGVLGGWLVRDVVDVDHKPDEELLEYAVSAHATYAPEVRHPVEIAAEDEQHLVAWLSKRLDAQIRAPKLSDLGFELLGGRLLPGDDKPSAQFMYEDASGRRLTLYVRWGASANELTAFRFAEANGMRAFYWIDRALGYAIVADLDKDELAKAAELTYRELNER